MAHLGMIGAPAGVPTVMVIGNGSSDEGITSPVDGFFVSTVELGQSLPTGGMTGRVADDQNVTLAEIRSEADSAVMIRYHARVVVGDSLAIVANRVAGTSTTASTS